jgi:hypothetical protein
VPHVEYGGKVLGRHAVAQLGTYAHGKFPGTDSLALNIMPRVMEWLLDCEYSLLLGEGDRLANDAFFRRAASVGRVWIVHIFAPPDVLESRRAARGSKQNAIWLKGRATKVAALAKGWATLGLNSNWAQPEQLAEQVKRHVTERRLP